MENTEKIKLLFYSKESVNQELAFQLMMAQHGCNYRVFGTIGTQLKDDDTIERFVETFVLIESKKDLDILRGVKIRQQANPHINYKCFYLNIQERYLFDAALKRKREDPYQFAAFIDSMKPHYFKL